MVQLEEHLSLRVEGDETKPILGGHVFQKIDDGILDHLELAAVHGTAGIDYADDVGM